LHERIIDEAMIDFIFRVYGEEFDVKKFLKVSGWKVISLRVKGEKILKTEKISDISGFNLSIYSSRQYSTRACHNGLAKVIGFIKNNEAYLKLLRKNGIVEMCIDASIITDKEFSVHTYFKGEILKLAYKYNIALVTTVYPEAK
jgi:hypothetical protein